MINKRMSFRYAPLWTILLTLIATAIQTIGTRYIFQREIKFTKSDFKSALIDAIWGYFGFKSKVNKEFYQNKDIGSSKKITNKFKRLLSFILKYLRHV